MTCIIVDDESSCIRILRKHIEQTPGLEIIGEFENPLEAAGKIESGEIIPDITFLDVEMPQMMGYDLAALIKGKTQIIFTTAHREYAEQAYEHDVAYYLLKPISYPKFLIAVQKAKEKIVQQQQPVKAAGSDDFYVKVDGKKVRVNVEEVVCILADGNYVWIHLTDKKIYANCTIKGLIDILNPEKFMQVHKSSIVNLSKVTSVWGNAILLSNKLEVIIGDKFRKAFHDQIDKRIPN